MKKVCLTFNLTEYCWTFCVLWPFSVSGRSTPKSSASCVHVLISFASNLRISSNNVHVLNAFPSLLGGVRNRRVSSAVSIVVAKFGLQYSINAAYASSRVSSDTSRDGAWRSVGVKCDVCLDWLAGDMAVKRGEALDGVEGVWEARDMSP
jgi:hypothetical protein